MILLSADGLCKRFGERLLFDQVSFAVQEKDAVGLVGANGCGKTTLFRILTGAEETDGGTLSRSRGCRVGWMEQHLSGDPAVTALDHALSQFSDLLEMERQIDEVNRTLEQGSDPALLQRQQDLLERFERQGGLTFRARTRAALLGLGLREEELTLPLSALSGGQRSKAALARLLVSDANLLLLDEPTNHLDMQAVNWLEGYLRAYQNAFVVISHDRYFLDTVTTSTWELEHARLTRWKCAYTASRAFKEKDREVAAHHYEQTRREIARLEAVVAQQRQWNRERNIRMAESKLKVIRRLEEGLVKPEGELASVRFAFTVKYTGAAEVLTARDLSVRYGERVLFEGGEVSLFRRERVFLIGPNGCGKTTLLRRLLGQVDGGGEVRLGSGVQLGYYDQTQAALHPQKTVLSEVWDDFPAMTQTEVRGALAAFLFKGDDVSKTVSQLSGGERARVALVKLMLTRANLLLLDEPTNHLDLASREALEQALLDYEGTLLMVSHDRALINRLADRLIVFDNGRLVDLAGGYDEYLAWIAARQPAERPEEKPTGGAGDYKAQKQAQSRLRRAQGAVDRCEKALEELASRAAALDRELADDATAADYQRLLELAAEREALRTEQAAREDEWAAAVTALEQLQEESV